MASEPDRPGEFSLHRMRVPEVFQSLDTGEHGLATAEARQRLRQQGPNLIRPAPRKPLYLKFLAQFCHLMALLLWVAGAMAFVAGMPQLGWAIWAVILINATFSFCQEYRAEKAVEELRRLLPAKAVVVRDGVERVLPAEELVPGDLLVITQGERVCADGRLVQEADLRVDQSTLSGESHPARKTADPVQQEGLSRTELPNLVFAGSTAVAGAGRAVVFATGMATEFGKIAHLTLGLEDKLSPLQQEINRMTRIVSGLALCIGVVFFIVSVLVLRQPPQSGFIFAIGMVVAFVPEGLLPTVTLSLAMGVQRMARRKALVKKLLSVETLGCCSAICTDKTGTLTENQMTVRELWIAKHRFSATGGGYAPAGEILEAGAPPQPVAADLLSSLLSAAALCNDARLVPPAEKGGAWTVIGDPTEGALQVVALKGGVELAAQAARLPRVREIPFDSARKRMSTVHRDKEGEIVFVKGAPKEVVTLCRTILVEGEELPLCADLEGEIMAANDGYAAQGLRVLAVARRRLSGTLASYSPQALETDLTLLGLIAMLDPPRPEVASAVQKCHRAGIRVIMVTGDYGLTAESVARRIGILREPGRPRIITGVELDGLQESALQTALGNEVIFARVAPEHKLRVVRALQQMGQIVAVTGDGVNDAPALRQADIGVAMGLTGTDVAKEAADMILLDDNFASIVSAVEEGRGVYTNIKKFATYIFSSNVAEAWPFILQITLNVPLALPVMQILAIDLGTDIMPALALGTEAPEPGIMDRPPRARTERLIDLPLLLRSLAWMGSLQSVLCFSGFFFLYWSFGYSDWLHLPRADLLPYDQRILSPEGRVYVLATAMYLAGVVCCQIGNAYACRTDRLSVFSVGFWSNRFLLLGILVELVIVALLIYGPPFHAVFELGTLPLAYWALLLFYPPAMFLAEEARKGWLRSYERRQEKVGSKLQGGAG